MDVDPGTQWHVVGTGDFNGAGFDDIVWQNDDGTFTDWLSQSDTSFVGNHLDINPGTNWQVVGTGDFNGDGRTDVLWQSTDGSVTDWLAQPDGSFVGNHLGLTIGTNWHVVGTGDVDGDGRSDVLWQNDSGQLTDWLGQPDGTFVFNIANYGQFVDSTMHVAGVGDFNGDGRADILLRGADGTITDWLGQANGGFADNSAAASQFVNNELQVAGVGDFNGDGKADVLWQASDGTLQTWVGSANGAILSPAEKLWNDEVANVGTFVANVESLAASASSQENGGSTGGTTPVTGDFNVVFGPSFPNEIDVGYVDLSQEDNFSPDPGNIASGASLGSIFLHLADIIGSVTEFSTPDTPDTPTSFDFQINGFDLIGNWHFGLPSELDTSPGAIVITANHTAFVPTIGVDDTIGYFAIDPAANGLNFNDGFGGAAQAGGFGQITFTTPGHHSYTISASMAGKLSVSQRNMIAEIIDYGASHLFSPTEIRIAVNEAFYESSFGTIENNPTNSDVVGVYQYDSSTWQTFHSDLNRSSDPDQIVAFYEDLTTFGARYVLGVNDNQIPISLSFDDYMEIKHHLGDNNTDWNSPVVTAYENSSTSLGFHYVG